jgi:hypothetical protein
MIRSFPRPGLLTVAIAASAMLLACDETEGVYRTHRVRAKVPQACIRQALEGLPGAKLEGEPGRWTVRMSGEAEHASSPFVSVVRTDSDTKLEVQVSRIVSGGTRFTAEELASADKATADIMNALVSACMPQAERIDSSCRLKARAVEDGTCKHAGP